MTKFFFPHVEWNRHDADLATLRQDTLSKTEKDLFNAELELERAQANRDMYAKRLERLL